MNNFLKLYKEKFFDHSVTLKPKTYCIVIIYDNNFKKEVFGIDNPWKFMHALEKNPRIKTCYIKND